MEMHTRKSLAAVHGLELSAPARLSLRRWVSEAVARVRKWQQRQRDYQALAAMSERELRDIGLTRTDVASGLDYGRWPSRFRHWE